ncbi:MAG: tetratricopeptide repeat protein [Gemmatales bacterium]
MQSDAISDPLVTANTQTLLGKSLIGLAEPGKAIPILEKATALRRSQLGAFHPETIESANNLALALFDAWRTGRGTYSDEREPGSGREALRP